MQRSALLAVFMTASLTLRIVHVGSCPTPTNTRVALGANVTYACPDIGGASFLQMLVKLPGNAPQVPPILSRGIGLANLSAIYFLGYANNNMTFVSCTYMNKTTSVPEAVCKISVMFVIYDKPQMPLNVSVYFQASSSTNVVFFITWACLYAPPGVEVNYTASVLDFGAPSLVATPIGPTRECSLSYALLPRPLSSCYPYQVTVQAENFAGKGNTSEPIFAHVTTVPNVVGDIEYVFSYLTGITLHFKKFKDCSNSSIVYYVTFQNTASGAREVFGPYPDANWSRDIILLAIDASSRLHADSIYVCYVTGSNSLGNGTSPPIVVYTTDVQWSTITGGDHLLNVTCSFAEGTQAKGCAVCLERSGEVVYQMVPRVNETAQGVVRTEFPVDCYNISVVDWELDGSTGTVVVPLVTKKLFSSSTFSLNICSNVTQMRAQISTGDTAAFALVSVPTSLASLVVAGVALASVVYVTRRRGSRAVQKDQNQKHNPRHIEDSSGSRGQRGESENVADYSEPVVSAANPLALGTLQAPPPAPYDNILISAASVQKSSTRSHYNFLQRFILPTLIYPQPSHEYEDTELRYNRLLKEQHQATPISSHQYSTISSSKRETPSAGTTI